jgi:uncharacterized protein (DUF2236 family)
MEFSIHEDQASVVFPSVVSRGDSETLLAAIERSVLDRSAGVFGPRSMSWRINREAALFLGAGRAALLQLAHPWVATALEQHSTVMSRPVARFHNTFRIVFAMIFGSLDQALAASRNLYALHTRIRGEVPEDIGAYRRGSHYEANEIAALRWVYATLVESAVLAHECVMPALTPRELADYYTESKTLAALFGLPAAALPDDWPAFLGYCREMEQSNALGVSATARTMAHNLLAGAGSWIKPPHWYRALTVQWLPERFRREFQLDFGTTEMLAAERAKQRLPRLYRKLPRIVRFIGPWHEAADRLQGRRPGMVARLSNRFWIGEACLPFAE